MILNVTAPHATSSELWEGWREKQKSWIKNNGFSFNADILSVANIQAGIGFGC